MLPKDSIITLTAVKLANGDIENKISTFHSISKDVFIVIMYDPGEAIELLCDFKACSPTALGIILILFKTLLWGKGKPSMIYE